MEVQNYDKITDKLLPCPFCGGTPVWYRKGNDYTKSQTIIVKCPKCRIERKDAILNNHGHTIEWLEEVAIKNWNQRAFIAGAEWQKEQMMKNSTFINEIEWEDDIHKLFKEKGKKVKLMIVEEE